MKKFFILLLTIGSIMQISAQQTFTEMIDSVFQHVNRNDATTGILYERVLPFSAFHKFSSNPADTASFDRFIQSYLELYNAAFDLNKRLAFDEDSLKQLVNQNSEYVNIGILHYKFNMFDTIVAKTKLYFDVDSIIREDVSNHNSLYQEMTSLMISPLINKTATQNVVFSFNNLFCFDNTNNPIVSLQVDFGDSNGFQSVNLNSTVTINYATKNEHTLCFIATYQNNATDTAYANIIIVENALRSANSCRPPFYTSGYGSNRIDTLVLHGYTFTDYEGVTKYSDGNVWIYYATTEKKLRKPVLIVDGFDPGNKRNHESHKDGECYQSIWSLFAYNNGTAHLGDTLLSKGYDLVILDFPDGGGYIERNAMVCIKVIQWINEKLAENNSKEEIVVVGPSMGGQITRYALRKMETQESTYGKHNCRLWISLDSPHQGANISYGAQAFLYFFGYTAGILKVQQVYDNIVNCVAARQMLKKHYSSSANSVFNTYYQNLNALGYPSSLRKIAITNGSLNGTSNGNSCELTVDMYATLNINLAKIRLWPDVGTCQVFHGRFPEIFPNWFTIFQSTTIMINKPADPGMCGIDGAPGGTYNTFKQIEDEVNSMPNSPVKNIIITRNSHCFMPIPSVLDISGNMDYCTDISNRNLVAEGLTPFQSYCGSGDNTNMGHVTFNQHIATYLINEIETYITGPDTITKNTLCNFDYYLHLPAGVNPNNIQWTVSNNLQIVSGQGTSHVIIRCLSNNNNTYVYVSTSNLSYTQTLPHYKIVVDNSNASIAIAGENSIQNICYSHYYSLTLPPCVDANSLTIVWEVSDNFDIVSGQGTSAIFVKWNSEGNTDGGEQIIATVSNGTITQIITKDVLILPGASNHVAPLTISQNTLWDIPVKVIYPLHITNGATLTVTSDVLCSPRQRIYVEPGSKLVVNGGKFTNLCGDSIWDGIVVKGNRDMPQIAQYQGTVELKNGAIIENAICGLSAAPIDMGSFWGGIIQASNTTFKNCKKAVEFCAYADTISHGVYANNASSFNNCTFTVDNDNILSKSGQSFLCHVTMWSVHGVKFRSCAFNDKRTGAGITRKEGILAVDAGFTVNNSCSSPYHVATNCQCPSIHTTPSVFENMGCGIKAYSSSGVILNKIIIDQCNFKNNDTSIFISGIDNYQVTRNNITAYYIGLCSANSHGFIIEENEFRDSNASNAGIGIKMINSRGGENMIHKNTFTFLDKGVSAHLNNGSVSRAVVNPNDDMSNSPPTGLQIICNNFGNNTKDIYVDVNSTIKHVQGNAHAGADNLFYTLTILLQRNNIYNASSQSIEYYYSSGNTFHKPLNNVGALTLTNYAGSNDCASVLCDDGGVPGGNDPPVYSPHDYSEQQNIYDALSVEYINNKYAYIIENSLMFPPELVNTALECRNNIMLVSEKMRQMSSSAISKILQDSIVNAEQLKQWYEVINIPAVKYELAELLFDEGKCDESSKVLDQMPQSFAFEEEELTEHNNYLKFKNLKFNIKAMGKTWAELNESEVNELQNIAMSTCGRSASMAQGVLYFFYGISLQRGDCEQSGMLKSSGSTNSENIQDGNKYSVILYPNPAKSELIIGTDNPQATIHRIDIFDALGKLIYSETTSEANIHKADISKLKEGLYIIKISLSNGNMETKKFIKQ